MVTGRPSPRPHPAAAAAVAGVCCAIRTVRHGRILVWCRFPDSVAAAAVTAAGVGPTGTRLSGRNGGYPHLDHDHPGPGNWAGRAGMCRPPPPSQQWVPGFPSAASLVTGLVAGVVSLAPAGCGRDEMQPEDSRGNAHCGSADLPGSVSIGLHRAALRAVRCGPVTRRSRTGCRPGTGHCAP